jgi:uncharacterized protein (UPF0276 family)
MTTQRPSVGLLVNATTPQLMADLSDLVDHLSVNPGQFFYDLGPQAAVGKRFLHTHATLDLLAILCRGRPVSAHAFSLSLPSAQPVDLEVLAAIEQVGEHLGGFAWISEHLNLLTVPGVHEPHADSGVALPVSYDEENLLLLGEKLQLVSQRSQKRVLLENPAILTPLAEMEMDEPSFLNRLYHQGHCGVLLDLHNLLVSAIHGGLSTADYLDRLDPLAVEEVHLAGGEEINGFYVDSHSRLTPEEVWAMAAEYLPRCVNLKAITFEFNDTYFDSIGIDGIRRELERMHRLADSCRVFTAQSKEPCHVD